MARPKPISERSATGELERVYHEIKETLRVTGVPLIFRTLAGYENILPLFWDQLHSNLQTRDFETGADRIRVRAAQASAILVPSRGQARVMLGESQRFQIQRALSLYHYVNPKILLLMSALKISLHGENIGRADANLGSVPLIARGVPRRMYPLELASDPAGGSTCSRCIRRHQTDSFLTSGVQRVPYPRTLARIPDVSVGAVEASASTFGLSRSLRRRFAS